MRLSAALILFAALAAPLLSADDDLARVALVPFSDQTKTNRFAYMPKSLGDAIDKSMQSRFEYRKTSQAGIAAVTNNRKSKPTVKLARRVSEKTDSDIVIYGHFNLDKKSQEIVVFTNIYLRDTGKAIKIETIRKPTDVTIFEAADKTAALIVAEINKLAQQQDDQGKKKEKYAKKPKARIARGFSYQRARYEATLNFGFEGTMGNDLGAGPHLHLLGRYFLLGYLYGEGGIGFTQLRKDTSVELVSGTFTRATSEFAFGQVFAGAGAYFILGRSFRLSAGLGGGYYRGKYRIDYDCDDSCSQIFGFTNGEQVNVEQASWWAYANLGIDYLIWHRLALGTEVFFKAYHDTGSKIQNSVGLSLRFSYVF